MANTSSAYDYSLFATTAPKQEQDQPQVRMVRSKPKAFASAFSPRVMCTFFIVVTLISLIIYNKVCLNEINGEINRINSELARMESDSVRFSSLLESTISLRAVAQQAEEELGMAKLDQYQTSYVYLYEEDQIILAEPPQDSAGSEGVTATIGSIIDSAKEYFGAR